MQLRIQAGSSCRAPGWRAATCHADDCSSSPRGQGLGGARAWAGPGWGKPVARDLQGHWGPRAPLFPPEFPTEVGALLICLPPSESRRSALTTPVISLTEGDRWIPRPGHNARPPLRTTGRDWEEAGLPAGGWSWALGPGQGASPDRVAPDLVPTGSREDFEVCPWPQHRAACRGHGGRSGARRTNAVLCAREGCGLLCRLTDSAPPALRSLRERPVSWAPRAVCPQGLTVSCRELHRKEKSFLWDGGAPWTYRWAGSALAATWPPDARLGAGPRPSPSPQLQRSCPPKLLEVLSDECTAMPPSAAPAKQRTVCQRHPEASAP